MIFFKLLLYWTRSTTGRSGTTQRFVAVDLLILYILVKTQSPGLHMDALSTPVFYNWTPRSYVAPRLATVVARDTLWAKVVILLIN